MEHIITDRIEKFEALPQEKRERIINAALAEFRGGYRQAHTDSIAREAGISKGLLFHYFGTKGRLYAYLARRAIDIVRRDFVDKIEVADMDVLSALYTASLAKQQLALHYPAIFDFITNAYLEAKANPDSEMAVQLEIFRMSQADVMQRILQTADTSVLRADIPPEVAMRIIMYVMQGYAAEKAATATEGEIRTVRERYDEYMKEFEQIIGTLKRCLYC
jgi:AcrR family transcriptional regulator